MQVIIQYETDTPIKTLVAGKGGVILKHYKFPDLNMCLVEMPDAQVGAMADTLGVIGVTVSKDGDVSTMEVSESVALSEYRLSWGVEHINCPTVHASGNTGQGIKLAIVDTGIAPHTNLKIAGGFNARATEAGQPWTDKHSHGTHCAGIAAALANTGSGVTGVAPGAEVYAVKVLSDTGSGSWGDVVTGFEWLIANNIQVASCSFGGPNDPGVPVRNALQACIDAGITMVFAAGNSGQGSADTVAYPARLPNAIAVSATANTNNDLAGYSSIGPSIAVTAPGSDVWSTVLNNGYDKKSGTSMATPHVAGLMCLAMAAGIGNPASLIPDGCEDIGPPGRDLFFGWGLGDAIMMVGEEDPPRLGRTVTCDASASHDPDGTIEQFAYSWGDGRVNGGAGHPVPLSHTYDADGVYKVSVAIVDSGGDKVEGSQTIQVKDATPNIPPVLEFTIT